MMENSLHNSSGNDPNESSQASGSLVNTDVLLGFSRQGSPSFSWQTSSGSALSQEVEEVFPGVSKLCELVDQTVGLASSVASHDLNAEQLLTKIEELLNKSFARQFKDLLRMLQDHHRSISILTTQLQNQSALSPPKASKTQDDDNHTQATGGQNQPALLLPTPIKTEDDEHPQEQEGLGVIGGASDNVSDFDGSQCSPSEIPRGISGHLKKIMMPAWRNVELTRQMQANDFLQRFVQSFPFQSTVVCMIIFQSIVLGWEAEKRMVLQLERLEKGNTDTQVGPHFQIMSIVCNVFFGAEILFRLGAWRLKFFSTSDEEFFFWNMFDLALLASLILHVFDMDYSVLRAVRIFRIARVLRIIRVLPKLRKMIYTLLRALESMLPLLVMLFLLLYVFALVFLQGAHSYLDGISVEQFEQDTSIGWETGSWVIVNRFGSVMITMKSLLASITGGVEWDWLFAPLMKVSVLYSIFVLFFILFFVFAVMNTVTGVFVDEAMKISAIDKDIMISDSLAEAKATFKDIKQFVDSVNTNRDGTLKSRELIHALNHAHVQRWLAGLDIDLDSGNVTRILRILDPKGTGRIDPDEFCDILGKLRGEARSVDLVLLAGDIQEGQKLLLQAFQLHQEMRK